MHLKTLLSEGVCRYHQSTRRAPVQKSMIIMMVAAPPQKPLGPDLCLELSFAQTDLVRDKRTLTSTLSSCHVCTQTKPTLAKLSFLLTI